MKYKYKIIPMWFVTSSLFFLNYPAIVSAQNNSATKPTFSTSPSPFPQSSATIAETPSDLNWDVCNDEQIVNLAKQYLVKQFGEKWIENYKLTKVYKVKGYFKDLNHSYQVLVQYKFTGPGNLISPALSPPYLAFYLYCKNSDDCGRLEFSYGQDVVAPYEISKLITAEDAKEIACKNGFKISSIHISPLSLQKSQKVLGKLFLVEPTYGGSGDGPIANHDFGINAKDSSFHITPILISGSLSR